jgi:hypothetical protein
LCHKPQTQLQEKNGELQDSIMRAKKHQQM